MEHAASVSVEELSHMEMTIKTEVEAAATSTTHIDIEMDVFQIDFNHSKQEPWLERSVKSEPALLVKEEILEDGSQAGNEQQCVQGTTTPAGTDEDCSTSLNDLLNVKHQLSDLLNIKQEPSDLLNVKQEPSDLLNVSDIKTEEDIDIGPTVLMDIHYKINKNMSAGTGDITIVDGGNEAMPCSRVKKESHEDKLRASRTYSGQKMTEDHYDEAHVKSCLRQQMNLQQHRMCQQHRTRSNSFKRDKTIRKPHLLSTHDKVNQGNGRKNSMMTSSIIAASSNQNRNDMVKRKQKPIVRDKGYSPKATKYMRVRNRNIHRGEKRHRCDTCDARFARSGALTRHIRVHTGEKPYQCDTCDKRFAESGALTRHMQVHTGEKPYQCITCDVRFAKRRTLTDHMRVHTGEKPYQCTTCDAKFAHSSNLTSHMRVHTGEKPHQCPTCDVRFAHRSSLTNHMRVHTGAKPYQCITCDARFTHSGSLSKHKRVHKG